MHRNKRRSRRFVNPDLEVPDCDTALQGALDIIAEQWSEDCATRTWMTEQAFASGRVTSQVKRGKKEEASKYELYIDHQEPASRIPSHRLLGDAAWRSGRCPASRSGTR